VKIKGERGEFYTLVRLPDRAGRFMGASRVEVTAMSRRDEEADALHRSHKGSWLPCSND